jgi:5'-phosphate synthase pdxT subunit
MRIGILALQGDFSKHAEVIRSLGEEVQEVRKPQDLLKCDGLIIPGGESTVIVRLIDFIGLREPLIEFAKQKPLFGTCAGLILMSKQTKTLPFKSLDLLNIEIDRNAFGRQIESFQTLISLNLDPNQKTFPAIFIRAPRIRACSDNVEILGTLEKEPVLIRQGHHLGATFHPELTSNPLIHQYFIQLVKDAK